MTYDIKPIPEAVRAEHVAKCRNCKTRRMYAKMDFHFDWIDCPYDCRNDYEHYLKEAKGK